MGRLLPCGDVANGGTGSHSPSGDVMNTETMICLAIHDVDNGKTGICFENLDGENGKTGILFENIPVQNCETSIGFVNHMLDRGLPPQRPPVREFAEPIRGFLLRDSTVPGTGFREPPGDIFRTRPAHAGSCPEVGMG